MAVEYAVRVNIAVKVIQRFAVFPGKFRGRSQVSLVCSRRRDGPRVHKRHRGNLSVLHLGALPVREVSGGMTDGEISVCRCVSRAEAGSAECRLDNRPGLHQVRKDTVSCQLRIDRRAGRINAEREIIAADILPAENVCRVTDVFKSAARAACDNTLVHQQLSVMDLVLQMEIHLPVQRYLRAFFHIIQNIFQVGVAFLYGVNVAGVEGHGDHRTDLVQLYGNHAVVIGNLSRIQLPVFLRASVFLVIVTDNAVSSPDGGEAGSLCGHDIHADPVIRREGGNARSDKFHHLILYISFLKHRADDGKGDILRTHTRHRFSCQIDAHHAGHGNIISPVQKLFHQLRTAFSHCHGSQGAVACVGIGSEDHFSAPAHHLSGVLVNDRLMGRHIGPAVALGAGKAEHVVILVNRSADRAEGIMAVCQHIGYGEFFQAGCPGGLDDADKRDIMRNHLVEFYLQLFHISGSIMCFQDTIRYGIPGRFLLIRCFSGKGLYSGSRLRPVRHNITASDQVCPAVL